MAVDATDGAVERLRESWTVLVGAQNRLHDVRERTHRNFDGGDAGHQWDHGLVIRHAVNYAVAARLAASVSEGGPLVDVGAGAGGFSVWAAQALSRPLVMVDQDAGHRELAARAFEGVDVHASAVGLAQAPVVFCMEVIEHVPRQDQQTFVTEIAGLVQPGGMLVMSTPDESRYWGGWSGYPPHVATLNGAELEALLTRALPGWEVDVMRLDGPGFALSGVGRLGVPIANRLWGAVDSRLPRVTHELAYRVNQLGKRRADPPAPDPQSYTVTSADEGCGTGLLARAVRR